jgi:hypothetical protein
MSQQKPDAQLRDFIIAVQRNCDIADALYAGNDVLCIYLMKMREFYRWASNAPLNKTIDRESLGDWISEKENAWDDLETEPYAPLVLMGDEFDCFDNNGINQVLNPLGYVYSAGIGRRSRPIFFVAALDNVDQAGAQTILISGDEYARCIAAPPAMSLQGTIYIRQDALKRYLSAMVEEWSWQKHENAWAKIVSHYGFEQDHAGALDAMVSHELENLILHEIGEQVAGELIGEQWNLMLERLKNPIHELRARAVRDNLADCVTSLPAFLALEDKQSLDFYYANMTPLRREMFPSFCAAYKEAMAEEDFSKISEVVRNGQHHWLKISKGLVGNNNGQKSIKLQQILEGCAL